LLSAESRGQQRTRERYGPWALVTGASDGVGRELAARLAASGVHLVLVARRAELLATIACELEVQYDVNCRAVAALTHHFGARFAARRRGGLVLLSSRVAFQGVPRAANYAATKAYVQSLAEGLAHELRPFGVDVIACAPGPIRSGFGQRANMTMGLAQTPAAALQAARAVARVPAPLGPRTDDGHRDGRNDETSRTR